MMKSLSILLLQLALIAPAGAEPAAEFAESVQTAGFGELSRASELMVAAGNRNVSIRLPAAVSSGEVIYIEYGDASATIKDSFMVTGIRINNDSCVLENKRNIQNGATLIDTIRVPSCRKLR